MMLQKMQLILLYTYLSKNFTLIKLKQMNKLLGKIVLNLKNIYFNYQVKKMNVT